jgi:hypothetical protein
MKACRFCGGMIQDEALKCRHCGGWQNPEDEPRRAEPALDESAFLAVKIYAYLLMGFAALYSLGMIVFFIWFRAGDSGPFGAAELISITVFLGTAAGLVFLALGLLKRKRIAYSINIVLLALALIGWILMMVFYKGSRSRYSLLGATIYAGGWLAYFAVKKKWFTN